MSYIVIIVYTAPGAPSGTELTAIDVSRETRRVECSPGSTSSSTSAVGRRVTELGVYIATVCKHTVRLCILNTGAACSSNNISSSSGATSRRLRPIEKCGKINSFVIRHITGSLPRNAIISIGAHLITALDSHSIARYFNA